MQSRPIGKPAAAPLIQRVGRSGPAELPDPAPYQQEVSYEMRGPDGRVKQTTREWRLKGLRAWLAACPTDVVTVPRDPGIAETDQAWKQPLPVFIDGYRFDVPKGEPYEVPAPIAEIIRQGQRRYRTAQAAGLELKSLLITAANPNGKEIGAETLGLDPGPLGGADDLEG